MPSRSGFALHAMDCTVILQSTMAKRKTQWHPQLAGLLRYEVERYYELLTNLPVGDLPRQADIVLLRRMAAVQPPFRGLWRYLTSWNVLEYKGPTVAARREHLPFLVEVGLGIARRLNEQASERGEQPTQEGDIALWYLANRLGRTFRQAAANRLGRLDERDNGIWSSAVLGHPIFLVSTVDLPVDDDSLPLHVLGIESMEQQIAVGQFLIENMERFRRYGSQFAASHEAAWEEVMKMAKSKRGGLEFNLRPIVETMGMSKVIEQLGREKVLNELAATLPRAKRRELFKLFGEEPEKEESEA
jgi:hypothetical protein